MTTPLERTCTSCGSAFLLFHLRPFDWCLPTRDDPAEQGLQLEYLHEDVYLYFSPEPNSYRDCTTVWRYDDSRNALAVVPRLRGKNGGILEADCRACGAEFTFIQPGPWRLYNDQAWAEYQLAIEQNNGEITSINDYLIRYALRFGERAVGYGPNLEGAQWSEPDMTAFHSLSEVEFVAYAGGPLVTEYVDESWSTAEGLALIEAHPYRGNDFVVQPIDRCPTVSDDAPRSQGYQYPATTRCPHCDSARVNLELWGYPMFSMIPQHRIGAGKSASGKWFYIPEEAMPAFWGFDDYDDDTEEVDPRPMKQRDVWRQRFGIPDDVEFGSYYGFLDGPFYTLNGCVIYEVVDENGEIIESRNECRACHRTFTWEEVGDSDDLEWFEDEDE